MSSIRATWSLLTNVVCFQFVMVMKVVRSILWVKTSFALIALFQYFYRNDKMNCATGDFQTTCEATEERRGYKGGKQPLRRRSVFILSLVRSSPLSHPTSSSVYHLWITSSTMRRVCASFVSGVTIAAVALMLSWQRKLEADHHVGLRLSVQVRLIQTSLCWHFSSLTPLQGIVGNGVTSTSSSTQRWDDLFLMLR